MLTYKHSNRRIADCLHNGINRPASISWRRPDRNSLTEIWRKHPKKAGQLLRKSSRPSRNNADGTTTVTGTSTGQPAGIRAETGDGEIRRLFDSASALHENFYENDMPPDEVDDRLDDVAALMDKLLPLLNRPQPRPL